jgi:L-threonylcarbamoyladenylate synthase
MSGIMQPDTINWKDAAQRLAAGEVGVIPTDTLYGIVGSALKPAAVEKIYDLRRRETGKPMIVLIRDMADLDLFQVRIEPRTKDLLKKVWPGPVSVVVPVAAPELQYLHRGTNSLAVRMPADERLQDLLKVSGPLVAPSANLAGETPAPGIKEAFGYFGDQVFYVDGGELHKPASALVDARSEPVKVLRPAPGLKL